MAIATKILVHTGLMLPFRTVPGTVHGTFVHLTGSISAESSDTASIET